MISVQFQCGHVTDVSDKAGSAPRCSMCGTTQIVRVIPKRMPRFVGTVQGPLAEYKALDPGVVNVATAGPLPIKEPTC